MYYRHVFVFLVMFLFSLNVIAVNALPENDFLYADNPYKVASAGELVQFNVTIFNNKDIGETFVIHDVWENSVLRLPMGLVGDNVYDGSPFGNHGTNYGASLVDGKIGKALSYDGIDNYMRVANHPSLNPTEAITLACWVKFDESIPTGNLPIIHKAYTSHSSPHYQYGLWKWSVAQIMFQLTIDGVGNALISNAVLVPDIWYFIVGTYDGETIKLYVNGFLDKSRPQTGRISAYDTPLDFARYTNLEIYSRIDGFDEVCVYDRALTAEEIGRLYNHSWEENLSRYNVELGPEENTQVIFNVKVPENASAGHVQKFLLTAFSLSNPEHVEVETVTVELLEHYDAEISLDENEKKGKPGETLTFQAALRNSGNIEDTYDIKADGGEAWNLSLPAESITVPAEEVGSFNISVTVPLDALPGDYTSFRIQAASRGNQNLTTNVNGTAIATAIYRFNITADPELRHASPGSEVTFSLELGNLGTAPDIFDLEVENAVSWDVEVDPSSLSLENGETGKVAVKVRIPENALIGQTNRITIQAISHGDPRVSAESSISVEVVTPFWERPDVRFLVGLIIGAFVGATLIGSIIFRRRRE